MTAYYGPTAFLYDLCELVEKKGREITERLKAKEIPLNETSLEVVDKIAHILKSLKCVIAMHEEEGEGESYRAVNTTEGAHSYRGSYRDGEMSGARGRGRNARRDSMGRYSSASYADEYSEAADELIAHLKHAKNLAEDDQMRKMLQKIINEAQDM